MKKNIVVGGAGFIGSHLTEALSQQAGQVTVYDNLSSGCLENIEDLITHHDVEMIHGDILDLDHMQEVFTGADTVFHLAALISVPESIQKPIDYVMVNTVGTLRLLEACRLAQVKNVVLSSSAAIYGDNL